MTAEQSYRLLQEIEDNRKFILMAYLQNPKLLALAEERIKQLFDMPVCNENLDVGTKQTVQLGSDHLNLETSVERVGVCGFPGAGQGATTRNGCSIPRSCNAAMRPENRAIQLVALSPNE